MIYRAASKGATAALLTVPTVARTPADIAVISESDFSVSGHGVHTAFVEQVRALTELGYRVAINDLGECRRAAITLVHTPGPYGFAALRLAGGLAVAMAHVTPPTLCGSIRGEQWWRGGARRWLSHFYRSADIVVAVSAEVRRHLQALAVPGQSIRVVQLGVDGGRVRCVASAEHRRRRLVVGVGQLQPRKGVEEFVGIAQALPEVDFVWVGGRPFGPLTAGDRHFRRVVRSAPGNVAFTGQLRLEDVYRWYGRASALVVPSRAETFGLAIVEAAAASVPLVLSPLAAFRELFAPAAQLCVPGKMAEELKCLMADSRQHRLLASASRTLADQYTSHAAAARLVSALREEPVAIARDLALA